VMGKISVHAYRMSVRAPRERQHGKPRSLENGIKPDRRERVSGGVAWIEVAQCGVKWPTFLPTLQNFRTLFWLI
jgi:hypothetical protein